MVELLNIDCMEYMATQPDNAFDLAIVDPPYGIGAGDLSVFGKRRGKSAAAHCKDYARKKWDKKVPSEKYFNELFRVSNNQIII